MKLISNSEINQFDQRGFLIKKKFFKKLFIKKISKEINLLKSKDRPKKVDKYFGISVKKSRKSILVRIENFYNKSKNLTKLINDQSINDVLSRLFRSKATLFKEKINFKPPGCGPDKLHQDSQAVLSLGNIMNLLHFVNQHFHVFLCLLVRMLQLLQPYDQFLHHPVSMNL